MSLLNKYLQKYGFILFVFVTLLLMLSRTPFWDETHAFDIACLKLSQIFYLTRVEGHTMLWYLIIKPFTSLKLYPYPMFILNWIFCCTAVYILWKKAPFSPLIKFLISFSTPFLLFYAPVARCYSIGILFLFLICTYYPKRFKKPYLYSVLILLCANTSVLCMIGSFWLGIIYLFELIKRYRKNIFKKKQLIIVISIFVLTALTLLAQFWNLQFVNSTKSSYNFFIGLSQYIFLPEGLNIYAVLLHLSTFILFYYSFYYLFRKNKSALFIVFGTYFLMTYIFLNMYNGSFWNYYFYYVYFIAFFWLFYKKLFKNKLIKILFCIIVFLLIIPKSIHQSGKIHCIYSSNSKKISSYIIQHDIFKKKKLYILEWWSDISPGSDVFLARNNINIYDIYGYNKRSYESLKNIFVYKNELIDLDEFFKDKNLDDFYILSAKSLLKQKFKSVKYKNNGYDILFETQKARYAFVTVIDKSDIGLIVYRVYKI